MIDSISTLQIAFNDQRVARTRLAIILRALPRSLAVLVRSGSFIQVPNKIVWMGLNSIELAENVSTKLIRLTILVRKFPINGVRLEKIYKRADWPPPGLNDVPIFCHVWKIKNPTLRAIRLKIMYKDVFSNERRFRFNLADSPGCAVCGLDESVEHQLFSCPNAVRIWQLYYSLTGIRIGSFYEVLGCGSDVANEIIKSVLIKSMLQIDRSKNRIRRELIADCAFFLGIEARANYRIAAALRQHASRILANV